MEDTHKEKDPQKVKDVEETSTPNAVPLTDTPHIPPTTQSQKGNDEDEKAVPVEKKENALPIEGEQKTIPLTTPHTLALGDTSVSSPHTIGIPAIVRENKMLAILIGVSLVVLAFGLVYKYADLFSGDSGSTATGIIEADDVVARVNGTDITGAAYNQQLQQVALGVGIEDIASASPEMRQQLQNQVIDTLVNTELILEAAREAGITVTDEEVESMYASIVEQAGGEEVALERLSELNISVEDIKNNIHGDLMIQAYINEEVDPNSLEVTEEEIQAFYDQVSTGQEGLPPLEDVSFQIEEQLRFTKEQEAVTGLLETLRSEADIEVLI